MKLPAFYPVSCHTNHIGPHSTFVAIRGKQLDGHNFIASALDKGAAHIVVEQGVTIAPEAASRIKEQNITVTYSTNNRKALAELSAQATNHIHRTLNIIGITGTKGKTTTAFLLYHLLLQSGYKAALLSTVKNSINGHDLPATLTTEQPDYLHQFFLTAHQAGVTHVVMEVAAQAVSLYRTHGLQFSGLIFTNFSHEHLEFYPTLDEYFAAKAALCDQIKANGFILINGDNQWCRRILASHPAKTFGIHATHDFNLTITNQIPFAGTLTINKSTLSLECPNLFGSFNGFNSAAAAIMAHQIGIPFPHIKDALTSFIGVPGRLQAISLANGATGWIDYAHNPDSYEQLFKTLRPQTNHLIVIFGAGGQRDRVKRPLMGAIAAQYADMIILTSDNPRHEDPLEIINDIQAGIPLVATNKVHIILDREQAIYNAYRSSCTGSFIVLLGKGPDEYQIIGDTKIHFSEQSILQSLHSKELL